MWCHHKNCRWMDSKQGLCTSVKIPLWRNHRPIFCYFIKQSYCIQTSQIGGLMYCDIYPLRKKWAFSDVLEAIKSRFRKEILKLYQFVWEVSGTDYIIRVPRNLRRTNCYKPKADYVKKQSSISNSINIFFGIKEKSNRSLKICY